MVFHWESPANQIVEPVYSFDGVSKHTSLITIDSAKDNAEGLYTCTATDAVGSGNDSVILNMIGIQSDNCAYTGFAEILIHVMSIQLV